MAPKKLAEPKPDAGEKAIVDTGVKGVVDLTKEALAKAPPATRAFIYFGGAASLLAVLVALGLLAAKEPTLAFWTFVVFLVFLCAVLIALVVVITRTKSDDAGGEPTLRRDRMPVLAHFFDRVQAGKAPDLLIESFTCPDSEPQSGAKLDATCIDRLWADPRAGSISAHLAGDGALDVRFVNGPKGWPANVTIRPCGTHPLKRAPGTNFLLFDAKVPEPGDAHHLKEVAMSFRIVDRLGTHWVRRSGQDIFRNEVVAASEEKAPWTRVALPLNDGEWKVFGADGNHMYPADRPDIDAMILALVVEFGSDRGSERPGEGTGRVLLRDIRLSDSK